MSYFLYCPEALLSLAQTHTDVGNLPLVIITFIIMFYGYGDGACNIQVLVFSPLLFKDKGGGEDQRSFSLEDVFNSSLKPKSFNLRWISGGQL